MAPQYINEMFTRKSTWYKSQLSSVARGIVFVNGNVSGDIVFDDIYLFTNARDKECYIWAKNASCSRSTAMEYSSNRH